MYLGSCQAPQNTKLHNTQLWGRGLQRYTDHTETLGGRAQARGCEDMTRGESTPQPQPERSGGSSGETAFFPHVTPWAHSAPPSFCSRRLFWGAYLSTAAWKSLEVSRSNSFTHRNLLKRDAFKILSYFSICISENFQV